MPGDMLGLASEFDPPELGLGALLPDEPPAEADGEAAANSNSSGGRGPSATRTSRFKGVSWSKSAARWVVQAEVEGKQKYFGSFHDEEEAARKYDEVAAPLGLALNFNADGSEATLEATAPPPQTLAQQEQQGQQEGIVPAAPGAVAEAAADAAAGPRAPALGQDISSSSSPTPSSSTSLGGAAATAALAAPVALAAGVRIVSRFKGVCWNKAARRWVVQSKVEGKQAYLGSFRNEEEAARCYDATAARLGRPLNFPAGDGDGRAVANRLCRDNGAGQTAVAAAVPTEAVLGVVPEAGGAAAAAVPARRPPGGGEKGASRFRGVCWSKAAQKWLAKIKVNSVQSYLGSFASEEAAARRYDQAARALGRALNFAPDGSETGLKAGSMVRQPLPPPQPPADGADAGADADAVVAASPATAAIPDDGGEDPVVANLVAGLAAAAAAAAAADAGAKVQSRFKGVSWSRSAARWVVQSKVEGKQAYLGSFKNEDEAARCYDATAARLGRPLNFPVRAGDREARCSTAAAGASSASWSSGRKRARSSGGIGGGGESTPPGADDDAAGGGTGGGQGAETPSEPRRLSRYRGVSWNKPGRRWVAKIRSEGKDR